SPLPTGSRRRPTGTAAGHPDESAFGSVRSKRIGRRRVTTRMPKIALIGAGSVIWARRLMMDILSFPELTGATLALMDVDPVRLDTARQTVERLVAQVEAPAKVEATLDRRQAVASAD